MRYVRFDPTNSLYKSVVGSVAEGEKFTLRLQLHKKVNPSCVYVVLYPEGDSQELKLKMHQDEAFCYGDWQQYVAEVEVGKGSYYYYFYMDGVDYERYVGMGEDKKPSMFYDNVRPYRLFCHKRKYPVVEWLNKGVMYQIFPDRFCSVGKVTATEDKIMRDWGKQPIYKEGDGVVRNRDFFGGNLLGIASKLDYLKSLGVTSLYLNPIFKAYSNHKYDTEDYEVVDPMFGTNQIFADLCLQAEQKGIKIVLDGVFNHVGSSSKYFNAEGKYGSGGAFNDKNSPYRSWFTFYENGTYDCWWNFKTMPRINAASTGAQNYFCGEHGIVRNWLSKGASGWRLDVVDEIADCMLDKIVEAAKAENSQAAIIGEVWEDASNKIDYGVRRHYLDGTQLDSVMNYPLRRGIIGLVAGGNERLLDETVFDILNNYPAYVRNNLMNVLGTHDTERILTLLVGDKIGGDKAEGATVKLTDEQYFRGMELLKIAAVLQYTFFGFPCLYYGDEVGSEGYKDPFCRGCYPWGRENKLLLDFYRRLGELRQMAVFSDGDFVRLVADRGVYAFSRSHVPTDTKVVVAVNCGKTNYVLPLDGIYVDLLTGRQSVNTCTLPPDSFCILKRN